MNTRIVLTASAIILGIPGILLTFAPELLLNSLNIETTPSSLLLGQVIGGLYLGYSMLNWMSKGNLIGGIYNRPVAIGNFAHFFIAGLALLKGLISNPQHPMALWVAGGVYLVFGILFIVILFRHPVKSSE